MILSFGSINIDMVMQVDRLPTPGDTVLCDDYKILPGGKGANQAVSAANMGSSVLMVGQIGQDDFGQLALKNLKERGVEARYIHLDKAPTGCASIAVDQYGENIITVASGANKKLLASAVEDKILAEKPLVLMQMEVCLEQNWDLLRRAKQNGCPALLNLAPAQKIPQEALRHLDYLVVNEVEARQLGKDLQVPVSNLRSFAEFLSKHFHLTAIITRGYKGAIAHTQEGELWEFPAFKVEAIDTTGAGDNFVGTFAAMIDQGKDIKRALQYAVVSSGLSCLRSGAQGLVSLAEIEKNLVQAPEPVLLNVPQTQDTVVKKDFPTLPW